ncbi:MAG: hypothetical protein F6K22_23865 [Okeania sp. SIO2F4]|uniref:hypothetical protein n=1 Tax=Okeania sp. SIO2F4 TaxID=2607790 RepID=UPI001428FD92|nr:hypothetical protein [Okeania sp. SIO2F4]NES05581.1 hypothetical protein [Okeania sp. SIO2F4]
MTIHLLWRGASGNELTVALYAWGREILTIHLLWWSASENELTIALYAIVRFF